ncbi:MAG TPA: RNA polymerase sigma factor [Propionibacteriaceae bacterium]|nr:RNA polymerase sigma factor [Propionibacteriaceae bacterium]
MTMQKPFEFAVRDHGRTVLRVCLATLGPDEAEDAWSDTFLAALEAWPGLPADTNIEAWLVRVAHHKAVDAVRRGVRQRGVAERVSQVRPQESRWPGDEASTLVRAVHDLPERQRWCVAYHHLAGLPHAEVAALIGGTPDAARRACADGVKALRAQQAALGESEQDGWRNG